MKYASEIYAAKTMRKIRELLYQASGGKKIATEFGDIDVI